jgi:hypothetical protein
VYGPELELVFGLFAGAGANVLGMNVLGPAFTELDGAELVNEEFGAGELLNWFSAGRLSTGRPSVFMAVRASGKLRLLFSVLFWGSTVLGRVDDAVDDEVNVAEESDLEPLRSVGTSEFVGVSG